MQLSHEECSFELLQLIDGEPNKIYNRIVTGDECWVHYYDPEIQMEAKQWKHADSPTPKRPRGARSMGKVMMTVFWDCEGILLIDFLQHKQTISGNYHALLISQLPLTVKSKRRGKLTAGVLLLHNTAPVDKSRVASAAIREYGYQEFNHPSYSPDLVPSDICFQI